MAEHDDTRVDEGEELLRAAAALREGPPGALVASPEPEPGAGWPGARPDGRGRGVRDPGALLMGLWFVVAGVVAAVLGDSAPEDLPPVLIPISFAVVGLGLLVPRRRPG